MAVHQNMQGDDPVLQQLAEDEADFGTIEPESSIDNNIHGDTTRSNSSESSSFGRYNWRTFVPEKKTIGNLLRWLIVGGASKVSTILRTAVFCCTLPGDDGMISTLFSLLTKGQTTR